MTIRSFVNPIVDKQGRRRFVFTLHLTPHCKGLQSVTTYASRTYAERGATRKIRQIEKHSTAKVKATLKGDKR